MLVPNASRPPEVVWLGPIKGFTVVLPEILRLFAHGPRAYLACGTKGEAPPHEADPSTELSAIKLVEGAEIIRDTDAAGRLHRQTVEEANASR